MVSASVGPGRGPPDLVDPLRPNGVFVSTRGYKLEQCGDKKTPSHMCEGVFLVVATRFELAVSAPLRSVQAEVPRTSWTLCARTVCPNQLEVVSLNSCKNKNTPSHMCEGVFLVVATRFELATSASRTQRSTKLSHATILLTRIASTLK